MENLHSPKVRKRIWYLAHKDDPEYKRRGLDSKKVYYKKHKNRILVRNFGYRIAHKDQIEKYRKNYWILTGNKRRMELRHERGVSKRYQSEIIAIPKSFYKKRRRALMKCAGELPIKRIQLVYEDNIKKYGTLTCYLCEETVLFGNDHLEHKTPLSRGGNNEYNNLAVACCKCNIKKGSKTEDEYRKGF